MSQDNDKDQGDKPDRIEVDLDALFKRLMSAAGMEVPDDETRDEYEFGIGIGGPDGEIHKMVIGGEGNPTVDPELADRINVAGKAFTDALAEVMKELKGHSSLTPEHQARHDKAKGLLEYLKRKGDEVPLWENLSDGDKLRAMVGERLLFGASHGECPNDTPMVLEMLTVADRLDMVDQMLRLESDGQ